MAYVTTTQLSDRLGSTLYARLTDRVNGQAASAMVAQQLLDEAEAEVESHLARRYATPINLAAHPELRDVLEACVLDVAEYRAWRGSPYVAALPARVQRLYADALRWMDQAAAGQVRLPAGSSPAAARSASEAPRYAGPPRVFSAEELEGL